MYIETAQIKPIKIKYVKYFSVMLSVKFDFVKQFNLTRWIPMKYVRLILIVIEL